MDIVFAVLASVLIVVALVGCVVPVVPGPILAFCGLLLLWPSRFALETQTYVAFGVACAVVLALDYIVPALGAKKFHCSRWGVFGCIVGTITGLFFLPLGLLLGPFLGAVIGEIAFAGKDFAASMRSGFGALLGFLFGVVLKLTYCAVCAGWCVKVFLG